MRVGFVAFGSALAGLLAVPAYAATDNYADALRTMLTQAVAGNCSAELMAAPLLTACREQIGAMATDLKAAGPVTTLTLEKAEGEAAQRVETYKVTFAKGESSTWHIGHMTDGKFQTVYSLGN
ncbi:hypothetical protein [uncultured Sphingomonas sp.]|uniref:hypothetical protein n=1 Tax=uncultured Sphingomonas sp. TaxID=158754 RepID=UPI0025DE74CD|nr:hypothetical protein [uncultured Sphingomonas sp.]